MYWGKVLGGGFSSLVTDGDGYDDDDDEVYPDSCPRCLPYPPFLAWCLDGFDYYLYKGGNDT